MSRTLIVGFLTAASLVCWGCGGQAVGEAVETAGDNGALETPAIGTPPSPARVDGSADGRETADAVRAIAVGEMHACVIAADREAYCWGGNLSGQLGDGSTVEDALAPVPVAGGRRFVAITAGDAHTCAISETGQAYCWGANDAGQLGIGTASEEIEREPAAVAGGHRFSAITAGRGHTCALTPEGEAYCWGDNDRGQLGTGSTDPAASPVAVAGGIAFTTLSAGSLYTCGVARDGAAFCWGHNGVGQLGIGRVGGREAVAAPARVEGDVVFASMSAGTDLTCAVARSGAVYCWGDGEFGQLGVGRALAPREKAPSPRAVVGDREFRQVSAGEVHACGVAVTGEALCWGRNDPPQLGRADAPEQCAFGMSQRAACSTRPVLVGGGLRFAAVAAGIYHTCGLAVDGEVYCWGTHPAGALGTGRRETAAAPVRVVVP